MRTPRVLYIFIGIVVAVLIAMLVAFVFFTIVLTRSGEPLFYGESWLLPFVLPIVVGGITMIVGLPIAGLLRVVAPLSRIAKAIGFLFYVNLAPTFFGSIFTIDRGWIGIRILFGLFGALAIAMALLVRRLVTWRLPNHPSI